MLQITVDRAKYEVNCETRSQAPNSLFSRAAINQVVTKLDCDRGFGENAQLCTTGSLIFSAAGQSRGWEPCTYAREHVEF